MQFYKLKKYRNQSAKNEKINTYYNVEYKIYNNQFT